LNRTDVRSDPVDGSVKPGAPLALQLNVMLVEGDACKPAPGAMVDIWQCDAAGAYSGAVDRHFNTTGRKFLRGYQMTDAGGAARFVTIYPGWYPGRSVHIHFKVRGRNTAGRAYEFDSQLYFDDALTDRVHAREPYAARGQRRARNGADGLFRRGGNELTLAVSQDTAGYAAQYTIGVRA
jgi:protocatechuate 3,4-dioxygenase beta subunit